MLINCTSSCGGKKSSFSEFKWIILTQTEYQSYVLLVIWLWEKVSPVLKVAFTPVSQMPHQPLTLSRAAALMFIYMSEQSL